MPLHDLIDGADFAASAIGGWGYLFSRNFRLKKHRQWREDWLSAFFEVLFGTFGVVVTAGLVGLAVYALWCARSLPRLLEHLRVLQQHLLHLGDL